jgi:ATP-dependent exoDNAse (exonuclease V) alpha subunit
VTIHKAQGLTLSKAVIDVGSKKFCTGLTFVACSRVRSITDLMFNPGFDFDRISNMANSVRFQERKTEDTRLKLLHENGLT